MHFSTGVGGGLSRNDLCVGRKYLQGSYSYQTQSTGRTKLLVHLKAVGNIDFYSLATQNGRLWTYLFFYFDAKTPTFVKTVIVILSSTFYVDKFHLKLLNLKCRR